MAVKEEEIAPGVSYRHGASKITEELTRKCSVCGLPWVRTYLSYIAFAEDDSDTFEIYQGCPKRHEKNIEISSFPNIYGNELDAIKSRLLMEGYSLDD